MQFCWLTTAALAVAAVASVAMRPVCASEGKEHAVRIGRNRVFQIPRRVEGTENESSSSEQLIFDEDDEKYWGRFLQGVDSLPTASPVPAPSECITAELTCNDVNGVDCRSIPIEGVGGSPCDVTVEYCILIRNDGTGVETVGELILIQNGVSQDITPAPPLTIASGGQEVLCFTQNINVCEGTVFSNVVEVDATSPGSTTPCADTAEYTFTTGALITSVPTAEPTPGIAPICSISASITCADTSSVECLSIPTGGVGGSPCDVTVEYCIAITNNGAVEETINQIILVQNGESQDITPDPLLTIGVDQEIIRCFTQDISVCDGTVYENLILVEAATSGSEPPCSTSADYVLPTGTVVPTPTSDSTPAPVSVPIPEPTPAPVSVPIPEPTPAPVSVPIPEPTPPPVSVPIPEPTPAPVSVPIPEPTSAPVSVPFPEPTPAPVTAPSPAPTPAPESAPVPGPTLAPTPETEQLCNIAVDVVCTTDATTVDDTGNCNDLVLSDCESSATYLGFRNNGGDCTQSTPDQVAQPGYSCADVGEDGLIVSTEIATYFVVTGASPSNEEVVYFEGWVVPGEFFPIEVIPPAVIDGAIEVIIYEDDSREKACQIITFEADCENNVLEIGDQFGAIELVEFTVNDATTSFRVSATFDYTVTNPNPGSDATISLFETDINSETIDLVPTLTSTLVAVGGEITGSFPFELITTEDYIVTTNIAAFTSDGTVCEDQDVISVEFNG